MKIYIGPYTTWLGPYQIANKLMFWSKDDFKKDAFGAWLADIKLLNRLCDWIESKKKRKVKVRIDKYDTWNMDHTLGIIALPMLKQLRETMPGAPYVDDEDVPEELRSIAAEPKKNEWDTDSNHFKRWDWVMNEMIYAFEMKNEDEWDLDIYRREPQGWSDEKFAERKVIADRIQNGFRLFGKYYQALWD